MIWWPAIFMAGVAVGFPAGAGVTAIIINNIRKQFRP